MKISDYHTQALTYIDQVKEFLEENGLNFLVFQQLMEDFRNNKISTKVLAEKAKELFKGNNDLLVGFNAFLPEDSKIEVDELDASEEVNGCVHGAVEFLNKAKLFLKGNDSVYQALLNAFNGNNKDVDDVYKEVAVILVGHQDLMEEFNKFVLSSEEGKKDSIKKKRKTSPDHDEMDCKDCVNKVCRKVLSRKDRRKTNPDCDGANSKDCMNKVYRQGLAFFKKIKSCFGNSGEYLKFLEQIHEYNSKRIEIGGVVQWVAKFPHLVAEFEKFLNDCSNLSRIKEDKSVNVGHKRQKIEVEKTKNKERFKCIEGKDFSNCETCTPSYWSMPEEYGVPKSNLQRSDLDGDVLNNQWVCRNSRQGNFKTRKLSKYEEVLNKCEDNRYEADMMLHLLRSTAERIDILLNGENKLDFETLEIPFKIEEYLSVLYARCVERLYGGYELEALNYNPKIGLPILLDRLKQKIKECEKDLIELTKLHLGCSRPSSLTQNPLPKLVPQSFKNIE